MAKSRGKSSRSAKTSAKPSKPAVEPGRARAHGSGRASQPEVERRSGEELGEPQRRVPSSPDRRSGGARSRADEREGLDRGERDELQARGARFDEDEDQPDDLGRARFERGDDDEPAQEGRSRPRSSRTRD
jgi:hypothetical protein